MASTIEHLEMFCLIWLDANTHESRNTEQKLRSIINQLKKFHDVDQCEKFIQSTSSQDRLIFIVSGQLGRTILPKIHHFRQVTSIYIYCMDKKNNQHWSSYAKVKKVVTNLDELVAIITRDHYIEKKIEEPLSINMFSTGGKSTVGLNGKFVFSQVLIDCLLRLPSVDEDKNELIEKLKQQYHGNRIELHSINDFETKYQANQVLQWYTKECFFYKTLNAVLRTEDIHFIFLYRSFIFDIQQQLQANQINKILTVYRAQIISKNELEILEKSVGEFISINSFFSTTSDASTALRFSNLSKTTEMTAKILVKIEANPNVAKTKPFANISQFSDFPNEEEILFMIGSIFKLNKVSFDDRNQFTIIEMTLCSDEDNQLKHVLTHIKQQNGDGETDLRILAKILSDMGKFDLAETYLQRFLRQLPPNDCLLGDLYEDLATVASRRGDFDSSMKWHKESIEFKENNPNISFSIRLYSKFV